MKKETVELIGWIKKQMSLAKDCCIRPAWGESHEAYNKDFEAAVALLDSLPEIESHLTQGGYIQDVEGVPCCSGDWVETLGDEKFPPEKGILSWCWPSGIPQFCILSKERDLYLPLVPFRKLSSSEIPNH